MHFSFIVLDSNVGDNDVTVRNYEKVAVASMMQWIYQNDHTETGIFKYLVALNCKLTGKRSTLAADDFRSIWLAKMDTSLKQEW